MCLDLTSESGEAGSHWLQLVQPALTRAVPVVWNEGRLCLLSFAFISALGYEMLLALLLHWAAPVSSGRFDRYPSMVVRAPPAPTIPRGPAQPPGSPSMAQEPSAAHPWGFSPCSVGVHGPSPVLECHLDFNLPWSRCVTYCPLVAPWAVTKIHYWTALLCLLGSDAMGLCPGAQHHPVLWAPFPIPEDMPLSLVLLLLVVLKLLDY